MRSPLISTSFPNGYVTRSTVWPSEVSARMRWNSEKGVPRGSKNGSGAIIRMCMDGGPAVDELTGPTCYTTPVPARGRSGRSAVIWTLKILVSVGLLYWLFSKVDAAEVWGIVRTASIPWFFVAIALYLAMVLVSAWRWGLLLGAQGITVPFGALTNSFLVATFFNNFLPSNIGGDVVRIRDTARAAGSKTLATTVVLLDRGLGLMGLVLVAACGASLAAAGARSSALPILPAWFAAGFAMSAGLFA